MRRCEEDENPEDYAHGRGGLATEVLEVRALLPETQEVYFWK